MDSVFDSDPFIAGFAVAVVAFSQAVTRFFADGYVEKMSPERVCRVLLVCLGLGILTVMLSRSPVLSLIGFAMIGIGTSVIFPLAISAAAQRTDRSAAVNVAALAQLSFVAFLLGPPLLGFVAEHFGIRWAFGAGLPFVVLSLLTVRSLGTTTQADLDRRLCASD